MTCSKEAINVLGLAYWTSAQILDKEKCCWDLAEIPNTKLVNPVCSAL